MKKIGLIIILLVSVCAVKAQTGSVLQEIVLSVPAIDSSKIDPYLHFCGISRDTVLNCLDNEYSQKETAIWRKHIKIQSTGAKEIKIVFRKFILSPNAKVSFYTDSLQYQYQGAYFVHKPDSSFISDFLRGENCTIAIEIPIDEFDKNQILISQIKHFTESFEDAVKRTDYSCLIDVNCSEGNDWCDQKRSVAIYYFTQNGIDYLCSGALVNNYQNNFAQYFLTARHCTNKTIDWSNTEFYFNYQKPSCNGGSGWHSDYYRVQGSQLVEYCDYTWSDNAILLITEPIPIQANVYYAGVDITNRSLGDKVTIIHHPAGLPKKITSGKLQNFVGPRWEIYWDNGNTFGGSSGAPVFLNNNKRVIANNASSTPGYDCSNNYRQSWVGKVKACSGIENILFGNSGLESYAGIDPIKDCQSTLSLQGDFYSTHEYDATLDGLTIQAGNTITVSNATFHQDANYTLTAGTEIVFLPGTVIEAGANFTAKISPCSISVISCGTHSSNYKSIENSNDEDAEYDEERIIAHLVTETLIIDENLLEDLNVYPNPTSGELRIESNGLRIRSVDIFDIFGRNLGINAQIHSDNSENAVVINISQLSVGIYFLRINTEVGQVLKKVLKE